MDRRVRASVSMWVGLMAFLAACGGGAIRLMPERKGGVIHFRLNAPGATRVAVVGTFNKWAPSANPMSSPDGEVWHTAIALPRGHHSYTFLVDDRPFRPPEAPMYADDGFGGENGIIRIP